MDNQDHDNTKKADGKADGKARTKTRGRANNRADPRMSLAFILNLRNEAASKLNLWGILTPEDWDRIKTPESAYQRLWENPDYGRPGSNTEPTLLSRRRSMEYRSRSRSPFRQQVVSREFPTNGLPREDTSTITRGPTLVADTSPSSEGSSTLDVSSNDNDDVEGSDATEANPLLDDAEDTRTERELISGLHSDTLEGYIWLAKTVFKSNEMQ
ncbi:hypothetical protein F5Y11DRAFT_309412 [Daldinia sp. FL1419]|nr:hypothetical protein F5Y11DRAFT_309412 [Daldinia sp. FL1419]